MQDFIIHNRSLGGQIDNGIPKGCPPRCVHCWFLSDDIKVIGNDS
jgi:wyosine [tRNA(Phe)-imidazoG37] synthetase (radical SAM superfamily)